MADKFLDKYIKATDKITTIIEAGASDPSIKQSILNYIVEGKKEVKVVWEGFRLTFTVSLC